MRRLFILIPVFNEALSLAQLWPALALTLESIVREHKTAPQVWFIDDGSQDDTRAAVRTFAQHDPRVGLIALSRNFGKEAAMLAALDALAADLRDDDLVIFMDGDGQDPPEMIEQLIARWAQGGCEQVIAVRRSRASEGRRKRFLARGFQWFMRTFSDVPMPRGASDFSLLTAPVVRAITQMREVNRFFKGMAEWVGYRTVFVEYDQAARVGGATKWRWSQMTNYAIQGLTGYSMAPLRAVTFLGIAFALLAFIYGSFIAVRTLIFGDAVQGYPTVMVTVLGLGGLQLLALGVIGEYLGRALAEARARPLYFIAEKKLPFEEKAVP